MKCMKDAIMDSHLESSQWLVRSEPRTQAHHLPDQAWEVGREAKQIS